MKTYIAFIIKLSKIVNDQGNHKLFHSILDDTESIKELHIKIGNEYLAGKYDLDFQDPFNEDDFNIHGDR